ncbi:Tyrosine--tRNA ligase [Candidatus Arsenophonus lipoptenae]|uniref:Tyrosine--tRNA ligase n=1 Tax=Candidatus Arsenophonus lipoptenae TaxID=634113 RepID=A0A0X8CX88_9GAMM|nr:tyrosine--tRNA ligase [Candidatus Arsenophonus lipoptenae]AMA64632.1 Tyrosine--tRNA ligase [Candidatus Arsenophonus lipoptenae]
MFNENPIKILQERDLIIKSTNEKLLIKKLSKESITLYCGFDPTTDSLHLGHLIPLLCLNRFQQIGHKPIVLIGGATGLIGDPSFKSAKRKLNTSENIQKWAEKICNQISLFLDFNCGKNSAKIVNNYEWFSKMQVLTFLRDIGKYFSVNQMINKEAIKQRIQRDYFGISFTEFSYNIFQSYDFANLYYEYDVQLQIGGSDQWGNITSGIDLTRRLYKKLVFGLTVPLIIKSDGTKFGKTESDVIWLDPKKTSPYKFYQFWINTSDNDIYRFLKFFTFIPIAEINAMQQEEVQNTGLIPKSKYILAEKVTKLVHGLDGLKSAQRITNSLFSNTVLNLTQKDFLQLEQDGIPMTKLNTGINIQQALVDAKLATSRSQARNLVISKSITVNGEKLINPEYIFTTKDRLFSRYSLLKRGKKNYCLINWQ